MKILRFLLALAFLAAAQDTLTNDSIVKMVKSGLGESLIINMIQTQPGQYSLKPDDLVRLKEQGVSEKIMNAMVSKGSAPSSGAAATDADIPQGLDIGIYFKRAGKWEEMLPEVVNWKTGGVVKHIATVGVVKGDINGHIAGDHSKTAAGLPIEILIYAPEGVAITEYQLLHLHQEKDAREFRTVTGGIMHTSGGDTRDLLPFDGKKVASRMYRVTLEGLGTDEYCFLPPGAVTSSNSASIGKAYTFRISVE